MNLPGNSVEILLTRNQAAQELGVSLRMFYNYFDAASLHLQSMKRFRAKTGGLNPSMSLSNWDIPTLKKVQHSFRKYGELEACRHMAENPEHYEN